MPTPDLDAVVAAGRQAIADAPDLEALREAEQAHLAKRSALSEVQRSLGGLEEAARRDLGRRVNQARTTLQTELPPAGPSWRPSATRPCSRPSGSTSPCPAGSRRGEPSTR